MQEIDFSEIEDIQTGHAHNLDAGTGCTVLISEKGVTAGIDVRGGAPATRESDLLHPVNLVEKVHAILLTGGSAFGLDAASGVMQYLEERDIGFDVQVTRVPIVCGAALFDLAVGDHRVRPDREMGYQACRNAADRTCANGSIGAGTGATVGKILGMKRAMKSGLGCYAMQVDTLKIGALVAVNCLGDVIDPETGERLAGLLNEDLNGPADTETVMIRSYASKRDLFAGNTTIGVVVTNAVLTKSQATKLASMSHDGYARTMRPAHSMFDGDTVFTMATGQVDADLSTLGLLAARVVEKAIVSAVKNAAPLFGLKCWANFENRGTTTK
ncbi:P1 family peptidase [Desulfobulbus oligotrophicus]|uniref:P1 family peptidase n=1 Tax=Desulfobulbus oligotrophicus TaxID=1909699 RepID=A0A7T5VDA1_9BACT|nr:P1 family peptidase [Desulfobulbus oligotrophicus]QQG65686.1 P1 family peptidase [Desulfobulbus oligotrophicus]